MIDDKSVVKELGADEIVLNTNITQNNIPIVQQNFIDKMNANNGFSERRMFRKIASIPVVAYLNATAGGWNLDDEKEVRKFLAENEDYLTVGKIDTGRSGLIIVK